MIKNITRSQLLNFDDIYEYQTLHNVIILSDIATKGLSNLQLTIDYVVIRKTEIDITIEMVEDRFTETKQRLEQDLHLYNIESYSEIDINSYLYRTYMGVLTLIEKDMIPNNQIYTNTPGKNFTSARLLGMIITYSGLITDEDLLKIENEISAPPISDKYLTYLIVGHEKDLYKEIELNSILQSENKKLKEEIDEYKEEIKKLKEEKN